MVCCLRPLTGCAVLLLVGFLAACGSASDEVPSPTSLASATQALPSPTRSAEETSGGIPPLAVVEDGPFTFMIGFYEDPALDSKPRTDRLGARYHSDIIGLGIRATWAYHGLAIGSEDAPIEIQQLFGALPGLIPSAGYNHLSVGQTGGRQRGGVVLPRGSRAGDRVEVVIVITTPDAKYGAVLGFTLQDTDLGLHPTDVVATGLTDQLAPSPGLDGRFTRSR